MPRFTTSDGLSLHFEDDGEGLPLICLAGLTRNSADFDFLLPHLDLGQTRAIRMDYRGRGRSDYAEDYMSYNILREGQDAIELMDQLGIKRAAILGTSRGGLIAMALSVTHPDRLSGVILNDIGPEVTDIGIQRIMDYVGKEPPFPDLEVAAKALKSGFEESFPGVPLDRWRAQAHAMWCDKPGGGVGILYDPKLRDALVGQAGAGEAPDLWQLFDGLKAMPLTAIKGANSDLLSDETFAAMQARNPEMVAVTVPDRGHVPFLDEPEALAAIQAFLERVK
jgi:pimeloyl-ACP methyl ester carboxylesterase